LWGADAASTIRLLLNTFFFVGTWGLCGLTMFENDDIDFYRVNSPRDGNKYKTPAGFSDYTIREEIIKVKTLLM
jgi:hypothetical protein